MTTHLRFFDNEFPHKLLAFCIINHYDLNALAFQQLFTSYPAFILSDDDTWDLVK
jgi:hypothetical protein